MLLTKAFFTAALALSAAAFPLFDQNSLDVSTSLEGRRPLRRGFPEVPNLYSLTKMTPPKGSTSKIDDTIINQLASNSDKYLAELKKTETAPPKAPSGADEFLKLYSVQVKPLELDDAVPLCDTTSANQLGFKSSEEQVNMVYVYPSGVKKEAYSFAMSKDGKTIVMVENYTADDKNKNGQVAGTKLPFEDIIAFAMAYAADEKRFKDGKDRDNAVADAVKKVTRIGRANIENRLTQAVIERTFEDNKWKNEKQFQNVDLNSKDGKALIGTANGYFAVKLLGANMAALKHGKIDALHIRARPDFMVIDVSHG